MSYDICKCGRSKAKVMSKCGVCVMEDRYSNNDWKEVACKNVTEALNKVKEAPELETAAKPHRYNQGSLEYWDAVRDLKWDYFQATAGKYIHRYKDKHGPEDLVKSINFIIKMIANETGIDFYELHKLTPEELAKRVKR